MKMAEDRNSHTLSHRSLPQFIVDRYQQFYMNRELCDYIIRTVDDKEYHVHKSYMAAISDHFYAMVSSPMVESRDNVVELKAITSTGLGPILNFVYGGELNVNEDNMEHILNTASHLQIEIVLEQWTEFVRKTITVENCLQHLHLTDLYALQDAKDVATNYALKHFPDLARMGKHKHMTIQEIEYFIKHDKLSCDDESDVHRWVIDWLEEEPESRIPQYAKRLHQYIRFSLIETEHLQEITKNHDEVFVQDLIEEAIQYQSQPTEMKVVIQSPRTQVRNKPNFVIISTSQNPRDGDGIGMAILDDDDKWYWLPRMQEPFYTPSVAVVENFLFVCGGREHPSMDSKVLNKCRVLDPRTFKWSDMQPMKLNRTDFPLVVFENELYAVGGVINDFAENTSTIERYSFKANQWTIIGNLRENTDNCAACVLGDHIYIGGGCERQIFISSNMFYCYDPKKGTIDEKAPMLQTYSNHAMTSAANKVYLTQGFSMRLQLECYDPIVDQWSVVSSSNLPLQAIVVPCKEELYFLPAYKVKSDEECSLPTDEALDYSDLDNLPDLEELYMRYNLRNDTNKVICGMLKAVVEQTYTMTGVWMTLPQHVMQAAKDKVSKHLGDGGPVATLQGHLWSNVCSKFQQNRGILKAISQNREMGVFFT